MLAVGAVDPSGERDCWAIRGWAFGCLSTVLLLSCSTPAVLSCLRQPPRMDAELSLILPTSTTLASAAAAANPKGELTASRAQLCAALAATPALWRWPSVNCQRRQQRQRSSGAGTWVGAPAGTPAGCQLQ